ncbi:hypothetical protein [Halococcus sp. IIIV-5B]|uniref:hypothetical protein n=1 Tax=Halococcus sp. IIIV-5B TaxID=2321230 RepID=UPI000E70E7D2|nr:hypothetical protein [Halococcus sp. IIIV-5B]RJT07439.1 hypothetical protein D3261_02165 [Halococcus sp. IIIV-5B]
MKIRTQLRHSVQVARAERMRRQRNLDHSIVFRAVVAVVIVGIAIGGAVSAYTVGVAVRHGQVVIQVVTVTFSALTVLGLF